jgi:signal transduction histidine kinase
MVHKQASVYQTRFLVGRYIIALSLIAFLSLSAYTLIHLILSQQTSDAPIINISGRQRMLSQKLTKEVLLVVQATNMERKQYYLALLRKTMNEWSKAHAGLQAGDEELNLQANNSDEIKILFGRINRHYKSMKNSTDKILAMDDATLSALSPTSEEVTEIVEASPQFLTWMNKAVFRYEYEANMRVGKIKRYEAYIVITVLILLVLEAIFIFQPMVSKVKKTYREFQEANKLLDDEIQEKILAQKKLQDAHNNLERRVEERTGELVIANRSLNKEITERELAEDKLRKSHDIFVKAMNSLESIVYVSDTETHEVIFANQYAKSLFGEYENRKCHDFLYGEKHTPCKFCPITNKYLLPENMAGSISWENFNKKSQSWYLCKDRLIRWVDGRLVKIQVATDITNQKNTESMLRIEKNKAEEATILKDKFVSLVSHDLKSPLATMLGFIGLVRDETVEPPNEGAKYILDRAIESGNNMTRLIDELLNLSRLKTGELRLNFKFFSANYIGIKLMADNCYSTQQKEIEIRNEISGHNRIYADKALLQEAIQNLVTNAIKFCGKGDTIRIFIPGNEKSTICVEDTGPGIKAGMLDKLFKYENRTSTIGTSGETGTGLGLPFVKEIIEMHGGELTLETKEGQGCKFRIKLPYVRPQILLVDNDRNFRRLQRLRLKKLDVDIIEAEDGKEALEYIKKSSPHIIITNIKMPGMDGLELLERLKSNEETKSLPVIVVSGEQDMEIQDAVFRLGAEEFLTKGQVDSEDFIPRVRKFIS